MSFSRCRGLAVDLRLIFNSETREQDVITVLCNATKGGKLGNFSVSAIKRTRSLVNFETRTTAAWPFPTSPRSPSDSKLSEFVIAS